MISDAYTIQFLLEGTRANPPSVVWRESPGSGLAAKAGRVAVDLAKHTERAGTRVSLNFSHGDDTYSLHEPLNRGWLTRSYTSPDEEHLAGLLRDLWKAASDQRAHAAGPEAIRERLYRQLLFE